MIDWKTGRITTGALGSDRKYYPAHPDSGVIFTGYEIPFFHDALTLVMKAAQEIPEIRYIGWDIAISANGPVVIEANGAPGFGHLQHFSARMNNGIGVKAIFQQLALSSLSQP